MCMPALTHVWHAYQYEDLATRSKAMFTYSKWAIKVILRNLVPRVAAAPPTPASPGAAGAPQGRMDRAD